MENETPHLLNAVNVLEGSAFVSCSNISSWAVQVKRMGFHDLHMFFNKIAAAMHDARYVAAELAEFALRGECCDSIAEKVKFSLVKDTTKRLTSPDEIVKAILGDMDTMAVASGLVCEHAMHHKKFGVFGKAAEIQAHVTHFSGEMVAMLKQK